MASAFRLPGPCARPSAPARRTALCRGSRRRIDAAVADGGNEARKAIDAVRVNAVARGFGKEARAGLGAIGREAELAQNAGERRLHFCEGNAIMDMN